MLKDNLRIALEQLQSGKLRSLLTVLGITIGIATVIAIVAVLEGFFASISADLNILGANTFQVQKWDAFGGIQSGAGDREYRKNLSPHLAEAVREECDLVLNAGAEVWKGGQSLQYKDKRTNPNLSLAGGEPEFFPNNGYFIDQGRALTREDVANRTKNIVLGMAAVEKLFPFTDPIGEYIKLKGIKFKVVGVLEKMGQQTIGNSQDNSIVIPLTTFEGIYGRERSANITISVKDVARFEEAKDQVIGVIRRERKVAPGAANDFAIFSNDSLVDTFRGVADQVQVAAALLGMVSLLVGSIGVMNIMLVTVTERTREIGIRKAVGARRSTILVQFLNESVLLSLVGGVLGMLIGFGLAFLANMLLDVPFVVPIWIVIAAVFITSLVGLGAGLYPAAKAAKMDPIIALGYE
ncbi:MAG: FtsX-like permease family protein [Calditrichaeota bacterium]|nr:MAG: peptide ABC transporter permease [Calditrichota bacterium]MBL1208091.1 FtsX-like permease family protein [Calditrichota bacterium]NOG47929.1 FtsX-like permease family protein [Calditrichota bacterium]